MTRRGPVVADTGPLIALARVDRLDLLHRLYRESLVPSAVHAELAIGSGRLGATALAGAFEAGWISVRPALDADSIPELAQLVDPGEAEAIVLAEQANARFLLIDDARGRRIARGRGVPVVGVAGVLLAAKSRGALATVSPVLDDLSRIGYRLCTRLVAAVREKAGE